MVEITCNKLANCPTVTEFTPANHNKHPTTGNQQYQ